MDYRDRLLSSYVSDFTSSKYGKVDLGFVRKQFPVWDSRFRLHLPEDKNIRILDAGCGYGGLVHYLAERGYTHCIGVDSSDEQVALSKKLGIKNVVKADLKEFLQDKEAAYDVILASDVVEHFRKDEVLGVLGLVYRSLSDGGRLIVQTPNAASPFFGGVVYGDFTHEVFFTEDSLSQVLRAAGFKQVSCHPQKPVAHGVASGMRRLLWEAIELLLRFCVLVETGCWRGVFTRNLMAVAVK